MICLSAKRVTLGEIQVLQIDAAVSETELYDEAPGTLEAIRKILQSGRLPRKRFQLPATPFLVTVPGELHEVVVESVEGWEWEFPGKRLVLISRDIVGDPEWLVGKSLVVHPMSADGKEAVPHEQFQRRT